MPNVKTIYAIVGADEGDGYIWATSEHQGMALVISPDAVTPIPFSERLNLLKREADFLSKQFGRKYVIGKFVFQEEVK